MKVRNLDTFYWIACLGGFRAASEKLNLTQPAISARIQVLEQDLGHTVFVRDTRNAELTAEGRKLFLYAERLMKLDQEILSAFSETTNIVQTIRLGSSETIVSTWLPDFLSHFGTVRRSFSFDLSVDVTDNLRNALVAREIDLAFLMGPVAEVSITNHEICSYEMIFAAAPEFANEHVVWDIEDIAQRPVLTFSNNTKPSRQIRELLSPHSSAPLNLITSTSLGAIIGLAKSGYGICAIPKAVIRNELENKELIELPGNSKLEPISFTASYVSGSPISDAMRQISESAYEFIKPKMIKNIYQN